MEEQKIQELILKTLSKIFKVNYNNLDDKNDILKEFDNIISLKEKILDKFSDYDKEKNQLIENHNIEINKVKEELSKSISDYEKDLKYYKNTKDSFLKSEAIIKFSDNEDFKKINLEPKSIKEIDNLDNELKSKNVNKIFEDIIKEIDLKNKIKIQDLNSFISKKFKLIIPTENDNFDDNLYSGNDIKIEDKKSGLIHKVLKLGLMDINNKVIFKAKVEVTI